MTVPTHFLRSVDIPKVLVLHKGELPKSDITEMRGFKVTTPLRAVIDLMTEGKVEEGFIAQALIEGREQGLISPLDVSRRRKREREMILDFEKRVTSR